MAVESHPGWSGLYFTVGREASVIDINENVRWQQFDADGQVYDITEARDFYDVGATTFFGMGWLQSLRGRVNVQARLVYNPQAFVGGWDFQLGARVSPF